MPWHLLADASDTINPVVGGGIVAAIALLLREVVPHAVEYLTGRDKLHAEAKVKSAQAKAKAESEEQADIMRRLDECERDRESLHLENRTLSVAMAKQSGAIDLLEKRIEQFEEYSVLANITADRDGRIVEWNHGAEVLFRYKRDEVLGRPVEIIIPLRDKRRHHEKFKAAAKAGALSEGDVISMRSAFGIRKDGTEVPVSIELFVVTTVPEILFGASIRKRLP